jgi:hypothetical protein
MTMGEDGVKGSTWSVSRSASTVWRSTAVNAVKRGTNNGKRETPNVDPLSPSPVVFFQ